MADRDIAQQREVVNAFFRAAYAGDFDGLIAVLDPDVVLRADFGGKRPATVTRGAAEVAGGALTFRLPNAVLHNARVNGTAGVVVTVDGEPYAIMSFTVAGGRIVSIDGIAGRERVARLASPVLGNA